MLSKSYGTRRGARAKARALRAEGVVHVAVAPWNDFWLVWWYE
jgi:hypothetical protein